MALKRFLLKLTLFAAALFLLDIAIGSGLRYFYFRQQQGKLYNLTYAIEEQTADVLILGSSRAMHQYNPQIIGDSLSMSCYNAGYDGQSVLYHNALLDVILERYTPSIVVMDVNPYELVRTESSYDLLTTLNPYMKKHPVLWETMLLRSPFEKVKHASHIYPFNSLLARIAIGNTNIQTKDVSDTGFTAQYGVWNQAMQTKEYADNRDRFDTNRVKALEQMILTCKDKGITLYMVLSPIYANILNQSSTIQYVEQLCKQQGVAFLSFQNNETFTDNHLFHDPDHLNATGADIFSTHLSGLLKQRMIIP